MNWLLLVSVHDCVVKRSEVEKERGDSNDPPKDEHHHFRSFVSFVLAFQEVYREPNLEDERGGKENVVGERVDHHSHSRCGVGNERGKEGDDTAPRDCDCDRFDARHAMSFRFVEVLQILYSNCELFAST